MRKILMIFSFLTLSLFLISCEQSLINDKTKYEKVSVTHEVSTFLKMDGDTKVYNRKNVTEDFYINPKKVMSFSYGVSDTINYFGLEKLGIEVFSIPKDNQVLPKLLSNFNDNKYVDAGTLFEPTYNVIELINPDLIILDSRSSGHYETIKKAYPFINVLDVSISQYSLEKQENVYTNLGKIFPSIKTDLDNFILSFQTKFAEISSYSSNYKAMFLQLNGRNISVGIGKKGRFGLIFNEFGFNESDPSGNKLIENTHGASLIHREYIKDVNPDVIFILDRNLIVENAKSDRTFLSEPFLSGVNAIKNNYIYELDAESWYTVTGGINATNQMISDIYAFIQTISN